MWSYSVQSPFKSVGWAILCVFTVVSSIPIVLDAAAGGLLWLLLALTVSLAFLAFAILLLREVYEIDMTDQGAVVFMCLLGATCIEAQQIDHLEGVFMADYNADKQWYLRIRFNLDSREQHIDLPQFDSVGAFVAQVQKLNPSVRLTGLWPMGAP